MFYKLFAAGLEKAKQTLLEMVILPTKRRDLFTGLRKPPKGISFVHGVSSLSICEESPLRCLFFGLRCSCLFCVFQHLLECVISLIFFGRVKFLTSLIKLSTYTQDYYFLVHLEMVRQCSPRLLLRNQRLHSLIFLHPP